MNKLNRLFWLRIVNSVTVSIESVCVFRIITGLFLLCCQAATFGWMGHIPKALFDPPLISAAILFRQFPSTPFFITLDLILLICSLCILLGFRTRISIFVYVIASFLALNFAYSFGKIDHSILLYVMLICMSFSGWGTKLALVPDKLKKYDSPVKSLSLFAFLICFAFFTAGVNKAFHWVNADINRSGSATWYYFNYYFLERNYLLAPYFKNVPWAAFKAMDFATVLFEFSPLIFLLLSKKAWNLWILFVYIFHAFNLAILNIPFFYNAIVYLAFIDYSDLFKKFESMFSNSRNRIIIFAFLGVSTVVRLYRIFTLQGGDLLFIPMSKTALMYYGYLTCWLLAAFFVFTRTILKWRKPVLAGNLAISGN